MNYTTAYVGIDVQKGSFTIACCTNEREEAEYVQRIEAHYSKVLNYLEAMETVQPCEKITSIKSVNRTENHQPCELHGWANLPVGRKRFSRVTGGKAELLR